MVYLTTQYPELVKRFTNKQTQHQLPQFSESLNEQLNCFEILNFIFWTANTRHYRVNLMKFQRTTCLNKLKCKLE